MSYLHMTGLKAIRRGPNMQVFAAGTVINNYNSPAGARTCQNIRCWVIRGDGIMFDAAESSAEN